MLLHCSNGVKATLFFDFKCVDLVNSDLSLDPFIKYVELCLKNLRDENHYNVNYALLDDTTSIPKIIDLLGHFTHSKNV